ncbi:MAG: glycoside hydrolase, partial [Candidatus Omnitrophica bacterium]|nr:glycoside hydrolase [Candidatus Omnitrophota bacterium]
RSKLVNAQTKETNSLVDIGLHYVALNGQNLPLDTDANGLPDYFEDRNGDGTANDTFNWTVARTHTAFPGDLQEYELSWNILVNDPAQDYGNEQNTQFESTCAVLNGTVLVGYVDSNQGVYQFGANYYLTSSISRLVAYSISHSGGTAFEDKGVPPLSANNYGDAGDPVLAVDKAWNLVYLAGTSPRSTNGWKGILFWKSTDSGVTFGQPTTVRDEIIRTDKPWITVDNTTGTGQHDVYLNFTSFANPTRLWLATSTNGDLNNWTTNLLREVDGTIVSDLQSAIVVVGPDHVAHVVWFERTGAGVNWLKARKVQNRGATLGPVTNVCQLVTSDGSNGNLHLKRANSADGSDTFDAFPFPVVAVNPDSNKASHLYVVYADTGENAGDKADIFLVRSTNGGDTWTTPVRVNSVWTNGRVGHAYPPHRSGRE